MFRAFGQPAQALISDVTVPGPGATASGTADVNGWLGGAHLGYNWQSQRWVYGVEADLQWTGQDGDVAACLGAACAKVSYELDWFGTLRGRLGYLLQPRSLLYVTIMSPAAWPMAVSMPTFQHRLRRCRPYLRATALPRPAGSSVVAWNGRSIGIGC